MIIPLGHEDLRGRRWPYVTIAIITLNVVIFLFTNGAEERAHQLYVERARGAIQYFVSHPYLKPGPELNPFMHSRMEPAAKAPTYGEAMEVLGEATRDKVSIETMKEEQAELDRLTASMTEASNEVPSRKYGYIPATSGPAGLIGTQFLHGGWLHLIFNMWFLWLAGCNVEDLWGRVLFPIFYLSAGVVAALTHKLSAPQSMVPLIGASGAVAGAMGAFLVKFAKTKIKLLWLFWFRVRTFSAPAYLMLPLWLVSQVFWGTTTSVAGTQSGVAFWAHVGGFVFGAVFALAVQYSGLEAKIHRQIEGQISVQQDPAIVQAHQLLDQGQAAQAIATIDAMGVKGAGNLDAQLTALHAAQALQDQPREILTYVRLIKLYIHDKDMDNALQLYEELHSRNLASNVPAPLRLRIARHLEFSNYLEGAAQEYNNLWSSGLTDTISFQALMAHASLMLKQKKKNEALQLFETAYKSSFPHMDWDITISNGLKRARALPEETAGGAASGKT